jgi:predicted acetyltransferase
MSLEVRAIRPEEREEAIQLWCAVWGGESSRPYFSRYFYGDVEWLPYYTLVAVEEGRLVSAVQICKRIVPCGEYRLTMGGIANVVTLPEFRGKGYNSACLEKAVAVMEADAMDFSLLFTGINAYYARLGYSNISTNLMSGRIRAGFSPSQSSYTFRSALPKDISALFAIYSAYNATRPIAVVRNEAYWRDWIGISAEKIPDGIFVVERQGVVCGYVRLGHFRSAIPYNEKEVEARIIEFGTLAEESTAITQALLEGVALHILAEGTTRLVAAIPPEPAIVQCLNEILEERCGVDSGFAMVRLLNRTNLFQSLTFTMNDRWIALGRPSGRVTFATPYGATALDATGSFLQVMPSDTPEPCFSQSEFFGLLFGLLSADQVTTDQAQQQLIHALFAPQCPIYWGADGF